MNLPEESMTVQRMEFDIFKPSKYFYHQHNYRPQRSWGKVMFFTGVCDSVNGGGVPGPGGGVPGPGGCLLPGGLLPGGQSRGVSAPGGGAWWRPPPGRPVLQAVRILLECILVLSDLIAHTLYLVTKV